MAQNSKKKEEQERKKNNKGISVCAALALLAANVYLSPFIQDKLDEMKIVRMRKRIDSNTAADVASLRLDIMELEAAVANLQTRIDALEFKTDNKEE